MTSRVGGGRTAAVHSGTGRSRDSPTSSERLGPSATASPWRRSGGRARPGRRPFAQEGDLRGGIVSRRCLPNTLVRLMLQPNTPFSSPAGRARSRRISFRDRFRNRVSPGIPTESLSVTPVTPVTQRVETFLCTHTYTLCIRVKAERFRDGRERGLFPLSFKAKPRHGRNTPFP